MPTEYSREWIEARRTIVNSQVAPTLLLATIVGLIQFGLSETSLSLRLATAGILLASGFLGTLVQFQAVREAREIARNSKVSKSVQSAAKWLWIFQFITPAIFTLIFAALMWALFI